MVAQRIPDALRRLRQRLHECARIITKCIQRPTKAAGQGGDHECRTYPARNGHALQRGDDGRQRIADDQCDDQRNQYGGRPLQREQAAEQREHGQ